MVYKPTYNWEAPHCRSAACICPCVMLAFVTFQMLFKTRPTTRPVGPRIDAIKNGSTIHYSSNFLPIFQGRTYSMPKYSSWEISGNCEDPFQVKFVFHTVCQVLLCFWHVRCRLHMFFPKEDPYFQQFLEMS